MWNSERNKKETWEYNYNIINGNHNSYVSKTDGVIIAYQKSILLTNAELKKALKSDSIQRELVQKYKKLAEATTVITEWKHDTVTIKVPIFINKDTTILYQDKCFNVDLRFAKGEFSLSDMQIYNRMDYVSGARRAGFLKTEYSIDIRNSNPCIITTSVSSYKVIHQPRVIESPIFWGVVGFVGGMYVNHLIK